jgi:ATP-binding cassette subfamily B protein
VPQDLVIFSGSIAENIRFVRPEASLDQVRRPRPKRRLIASSRAAARRMRHFRWQAESDPLSRGQRQRLAIARAIVKNAPVLLLDKATSALDAESEQLGRQALDRMADQRTTIVIAHRLATGQKADRIVFMENGRSVETGLHSDLTQGCPVRSPAIPPPSWRGRQSRLVDSCTGTGVGFPEGTQTWAICELPQAAPDHKRGSCKL